VNGVGTACYECVEHYLDEDLVWAEDVEGSLCESCRSFYQRCERYVVYRHYSAEHEACEYCVEDYMLECASCGDRFWENDLTAMPIAWFEQPGSTLVCGDCFGEFRNAAESDETDDGVSPRGHLQLTFTIS
jgi:hypothetical protein